LETQNTSPLSSKHGTHKTSKARFWLSSEHGTHKTVKARLWPWLGPFCRESGDERRHESIPTGYELENRYEPFEPVTCWVWGVEVGVWGGDLF